MLFLIMLENNKNKNKTKKQSNNISHAAHLYASMQIASQLHLGLPMQNCEGLGHFVFVGNGKLTPFSFVLQSAICHFTVPLKESKPQNILSEKRCNGLFDI